MKTFDQIMRGGGEAAIQQVGRFFMRDDPVHHTLRRVTSRLAELGIPYVVFGGMAVVAHGYDRAMVKNL